MERSSARITTLDGARGVFLLCVFAGHLDSPLFPGGTIVVDMFFELSGFLITALLLREYATTGSISVSRFYARRMFRLYPALFVTVLITLPLSQLEHAGQPALDSLAALFYVTNIWAQFQPAHYITPMLHTWSLGVEEQFYLIWPLALILVLRSRRSLVVVLLGASIGCLGLTGEFARSGWPPLAVPAWLPTAQWPEFMGGALLAYIQTRTTLTQSFRRFVGWPAAVVSIFLILVIAVHPLYNWWMYGGLVVLPAWVLLAHLVLAPDSWMSRPFATKPLVWLGERSYGFYLIHVPVIVLLAGATHSEIVLLSLALPVTLALTMISWHFVETPFLRRKAGFSAPGVSLARPEGATHGLNRDVAMTG